MALLHRLVRGQGGQVHHALTAAFLQLQPATPPTVSLPLLEGLWLRASVRCHSSNGNNSNSSSRACNGHVGANAGDETQRMQLSRALRHAQHTFSDWGPTTRSQTYASTTAESQELKGGEASELQRSDTVTVGVDVGALLDITLPPNCVRVNVQSGSMEAISVQTR